MATSTETTAIQQLAQIAADNITGATRDDGTTFYRPLDGAPEWVGDLLYGNAGSSDWGRDKADSVIRAIAEGTIEDEDDLLETADSLTDIYSHHLYQYLVDIGADYVNEAFDEHGAFDDIDKLLMVAQVIHIERIAQGIYSDLAARAATMEEEEEDETAE